MFDKLKAKIFPCEARIRDLKEQHMTASAANQLAHSRLMRACGKECATHFTFPDLKESHIVNPR